MSRGVKITPPPHAAPPRSAPTSPPPGLLSRGLRRGHKRTQPIQQARSRLAPCERGPAREAPLPLLRVLLLVERVGAHLQSAERRVQSVECKQRLAESTRGTRGTRHTRHSAHVALGASGAGWRGGLCAHLVQGGPRHVEAGGQPDGVAAPPAAHGLHRARVAHGLALQEDGRAVVE